MDPAEYSEADVHQQFDDALRRHQTYAGPRAGIGTIRHRAMQGGYVSRFAGSDNSIVQPDRQLAIGSGSSRGFNLNAGIPTYHARGMPARTFAGPKVGNAALFPLDALSLLVALGGSGKTTLAIALGAYIAAGKQWGAEALRRRKVVVFTVEETQDELNRKFGAAVHAWDDAERDAARENLRLMSCLGRDVRLTKVQQRQIVPTDVANLVIQAAKEFGATVIILDHLQGFASGDLNQSDTATVIAEVSNRIVSETGAAVVQTAHIAKHNIRAEEVLDGFTTGSLAFENAARQVAGIIPLPQDDAEAFNLDPTKCLMLGMPKNSYGPARERAFLRKVYVPDFHTITVEPLVLAPRAAPRSRRERLKDEIVEHVKQNPGTSAGALDRCAGKGGRFKASKHDVREATAQLEAEGRLRKKTLSDQERRALRVPHQVKQVYERVG